MKITKDKKSQKDITMDMTPMIDCVFQLITFFMLITDMSQRELEELYLPIADAADPDKPNPADKRPIVNILDDGTIWIKGDKYYDPKNPDDYERVKAYLAGRVKFMPRAPVKPGSTIIAPDTPLLIRADQSTPVHHIQKVMELCGQKGIQIWKVQLAAGQKEKPKNKGGN
jgi:biopolymer transport protein ExbD